MTRCKEDIKQLKKNKRRGKEEEKKWPRKMHSDDARRTLQHQGQALGAYIILQCIT